MSALEGGHFRKMSILERVSKNLDLDCQLRQGNLLKKEELSDVSMSAVERVPYILMHSSASL